LSLDAFNQKRIKLVFPTDWKNPKPAQIYDLVVIGGGPGGLAAASLAAGMKAKVALVEKEHLGGECFNVGCIPSKALLRSARCAAQIRKAAEFGIKVSKGWKVDFLAVMTRVRQLQSELAPHDSAAHLKSLGIDVFLGAAHFTDVNTIEVGKMKLQFKKAIIATGTQPVIPDIPGLKEAGYLTNQTIFDLTELPRSLAVLGSGPIGCELAQAFLHLGTGVTLITHGKALLPREDPLVTERLQAVFEKEGMSILFQTQVKRVGTKGKTKELHLGSGKTLSVDALLIAAGRIPTVKGLGLEKAGVIYDLKEGVAANENLQTSNPAIYVAGDVGSRYKFTHIAMELGRMAVHNALQEGNERHTALHIPWSTYTQPEVAHIGLQEHEAKEQGHAVDVSLVELKDTERAVLDGETVGFVKILMQAGTDHILGATVMAAHAGEMIAEVAVAMAGQKGVTGIAKAIHPFPTQSEAIRSDATVLLNMGLHKKHIA